MLGIADDDTVFTDFETEEHHSSSPRKELPDGRTIYISRDVKKPRQVGAPVLCDFGAAMPGGGEHLEDIQPDIYRAPEVILEAPWSYGVDMWNVGCIECIRFGISSNARPYDPENQTYRNRVYLAEMIRLLGPLPPSLLAQGKSSHRFFSDKGGFALGSRYMTRFRLKEGKLLFKRRRVFYV